MSFNITRCATIVGAVALAAWIAIGASPITEAGEKQGENKVLSLLWPSSATVDLFGKQTRAITYQFAPEKAFKGRVVWKADRDSPVLLYDPRGEFRVTTESIIGSWTLGGRNHRDEGVPREPWRDGYEVLASLDRNRDNAVSGRELQVVSLWFDENRDGEAQRGEVVAADRVGLAEIIIRGEPQVLPDGSKYYRQGYRRYGLNGQLVTGPSISWSVASVEKKPPATASPMPTPSHTPSPTASPTTEPTNIPSPSPTIEPATPTATPTAIPEPTETQTPVPTEAQGEQGASSSAGGTEKGSSDTQRNSSLFNGYWRSVNEIDGPPQNTVVFLQVLEGGEVRGSSFSPITDKRSEGIVGSAEISLLSGRVSGEAGEKISYTTTAPDSKQETVSVATVFERDGKIFMKGETTTDVADDDGVGRKVSFEWLAVKSVP